MSIELQPEATTEPPVYQCRHIFTDGHRCGSRSLRRERFCYYHHQTRKPATGPRLSLAPDPTATFDLPLPEDRSAIQQSIGIIIQRIAGNQLDHRRAGLLLYALQIASCNLPKALKNAQPIETVEEITIDDLHGPLAPESELHKPKGEKSLETILLEQWAKEDQLCENDQALPNLIDLQATADPSSLASTRKPHPEVISTEATNGPAVRCAAERPPNFVLSPPATYSGEPTSASATPAQSPSAESRSSLPRSCTASHPGKTSQPDSP